MTLVRKFDGFDATAAIGDPVSPARRNMLYRAAKRVFALGFSARVLLPATLTVAVVLILANPFLKPGPLLSVQTRMGRDCTPFRTYRFRTMDVRPHGIRAPDDPIQTDRIWPLGKLLRKSRLDELPQILNVYRGEMSLMGRRPDYLCPAHSSTFARSLTTASATGCCPASAGWPRCAADMPRQPSRHGRICNTSAAQTSKWTFDLLADDRDHVPHARRVMHLARPSRGR